MSCTFGTTVALRGLEAFFEPGQARLIVGANGSGKSTLLRIIGTTLKPTAGQVAYSPTQTVEGVRREVGWVSHEGMMYPDLTGRENVILAASLYGVGAEEAWREAAQRVALGRFADRPLRTNSRGQRQRIALARSLVHRPSLLLLDEPTSGLDPEGVETLLRVLEDEVQTGTLVLIVTHDPKVFGEVGEVCLELERGRARETVAQNA